jgi:hypothetical protein
VVQKSLLFSVDTQDGIDCTGLILALTSFLTYLLSTPSARCARIQAARGFRRFLFLILLVPLPSGDGAFFISNGDLK